MRLSLATWSLPHCTLAECAGIARALGIGALDVGLFYRAALDRGLILSDPAAAAAPLRALGMDLANYYHLFGDGLAGRNLALPGTVDHNARDLDRVLTFADAAGIATVFILPGIINPGQSRADAARVAAESLTALLQVARHHSARLCIEPHVHSWAESPALVLDLIDRTGIGLALDYAHFACLGYRQEEVDPLAPPCRACPPAPGPHGRLAGQVRSGHAELSGAVRHAARRGLYRRADAGGGASGLHEHAGRRRADRDRADAGQFQRLERGDVMAGYAWVLEVRPGYEDEYKKRHDEIWPEMLDALRRSGIRNYNIFRHGLTLFGYFETDDLAASQKAIAAEPANARWGAWMGPIMKVEVDPATQFPYLLPKQFYMA